MKVLADQVLIRETYFVSERVAVKFASILQDAGFRVRLGTLS